MLISNQNAIPATITASPNQSLHTLPSEHKFDVLLQQYSEAPKDAATQVGSEMVDGEYRGIDFLLLQNGVPPEFHVIYSASPIFLVGNSNGEEIETSRVARADPKYFLANDDKGAEGHKPDIPTLNGIVELFPGNSVLYDGSIEDFTFHWTPVFAKGGLIDTILKVNVNQDAKIDISNHNQSSRPSVNLASEELLEQKAANITFKARPEYISLPSHAKTSSVAPYGHRKQTENVLTSITSDQLKQEREFQNDDYNMDGKKFDKILLTKSREVAISNSSFPHKDNNVTNEEARPSAPYSKERNEVASNEQTSAAKKKTPVFQVTTEKTTQAELYESRDSLKDRNLVNEMRVKSALLDDFPNRNHVSVNDVTIQNKHTTLTTNLHSRFSMFNSLPPSEILGLERVMDISIRTSLDTTGISFSSGSNDALELLSRYQADLRDALRKSGLESFDLSFNSSEDTGNESTQRGREEDEIRVILQEVNHPSEDFPTAVEEVGLDRRV